MTLLRLIVVATICVLISVSTSQPIPNVPWADATVFELDENLSDEFDSETLDLSKWDENGQRNPQTGCPECNGLRSTASNPIYATYFSTSTDLANPNGPRHREYELRDGKMWINVNTRDESFFEAREYYCNKTIFTCNHDNKTPCFHTNVRGKPVIRNGKYAGVMHDKCKTEPYCIPHYKNVMNKPARQYRKYTSTHLSSKRLLRYGFMETKVRLADSSSVLAVWMHGHDATGGKYCRFRLKGDGSPRIVRECPSRVRSERWQEIDPLEAMNSDFHKNKYVPNMHVLACSKGEFSSATSVDKPSGEMGGGPIVIGNLIKNDALFGSSGVPKAEPKPRPLRVLSCRDNYVFEIQNLLNQKTQLAHGRRLKFFRNSELNITEEIEEHLQYQDNQLLVVEDLEDIRMTDNGLENVSSGRDSVKQSLTGYPMII